MHKYIRWATYCASNYSRYLLIVKKASCCGRGVASPFSFRGWRRNKLFSRRVLIIMARACSTRQQGKLYMRVSYRVFLCGLEFDTVKSSSANLAARVAFCEGCCNRQIYSSMFPYTIVKINQAPKGLGSSTTSPPKNLT